MQHVSNPVDVVALRRAEALRRARDGDRDALNELIAELTPLLWNVVRRQGVDRVAAEDVVQDTWLRLWSSLDKIQTPEALVGWLVTVAKREAIRLWKAGCREEPVEPEWDSMMSEDPGVDEHVTDQIRVQGQYRVLWGLVTSLTERCQELIRIIAFTDRPNYETVSSALGIPRGSIGPTRGRCLAKLRQLLRADPAWNDRVELSDE